MRKQNYIISVCKNLYQGIYHALQYYCDFFKDAEDKFCVSIVIFIYFFYFIFNVLPEKEKSKRMSV